MFVVWVVPLCDTFLFSFLFRSVFGEVTNGMDVVKAIEKCGSQSGRLSKDCKIVDCGQIPASKQ